MAALSLDAVLWALAGLFYGVGDTVTTVVGVRRDGVEEHNPVVGRLLGPSPDARSFVALKLLAFALFGGVYYAFRDRPARAAVPAALTVLGVVVTVVNVRVLRRRRHRF